MPLISIETMIKTIAEQDSQIKELKSQVAELQTKLAQQSSITLTNELIDVVRDYPEKLHYPIIASIERH